MTEKYTQATLYVPHKDGGCIDVGELKINGFQLISDEDLSNLIQSRNEILNELRKIADIRKNSYDAAHQIWLDAVAVCEKYDYIVIAELL